MSDPKPAVGRIVHFTHHVGGKTGERSPCQAAIITNVYTDPTDGPWVALAVFSPLGQSFYLKVPQEDGIPPYYVDGDRSHAGTWHWPERVG